MTNSKQSVKHARRAGKDILYLSLSNQGSCTIILHGLSTRTGERGTWVEGWGRGRREEYSEIGRRGREYMNIGIILADARRIEEICIYKTVRRVSQDVSWGIGYAINNCVRNYAYIPGTQLNGTRHGSIVLNNTCAALKSYYLYVYAWSVLTLLAWPVEFYISTRRFAFHVA